LFCASTDGANGGTISSNVSVESDLPVTGKVTLDPSANTDEYAFMPSCENNGTTLPSTSSPQDEITLTYVGSTLWKDMFDVAIDSNYAYCAMRWGLMILDVSAPDSPFFVSQVYMPHGIAKRVVVAGSYAYVVHDSSDLQIVDISSPSDPVLAGSYKTPGNALDVAVAGNYAYVADSSAGLQIVDVSNPAVPALVTSYDTPGLAYAVTVVGNLAYLADYNSLQIIDISDPSNPDSVGAYFTPGYALDLALVGNYTYIVDSSYGLHIVNVADPSAPDSAGSYGVPTKTRDITVADSLAYVIYCCPGYYPHGVLSILDISDPTNPVQVGSYDMPYGGGHPRNVAVAGNYAFMAASFGGLQVVDVSDSSDPILAGSYDTPGGLGPGT
jgi:hypothetical protein